MRNRSEQTPSVTGDEPFAEPETQISDADIEHRAGLGWLARAGTAMMVAAAALLREAKPASANHCVGTYHCGCCCLAKPPTSWSTCGPTYTLRSWVCCSGNIMYRCYECTTGTTCSSGSFEKSKCAGVGSCPM